MTPLSLAPVRAFPGNAANLLQSKVSHGRHTSLPCSPLRLAASFCFAGRYSTLRQDHPRDAGPLLRRQPLQPSAHHPRPSRVRRQPLSQRLHPGRLIRPAVAERRDPSGGLSPPDLYLLADLRRSVGSPEPGTLTTSTPGPPHSPGSGGTTGSFGRTQPPRFIPTRRPSPLRREPRSSAADSSPWAAWKTTPPKLSIGTSRRSPSRRPTASTCFAPLARTTSNSSCSMKILGRSLPC